LRVKMGGGQSKTDKNSLQDVKVSDEAMKLA